MVEFIKLGRGGIEVAKNYYLGSVYCHIATFIFGVLSLFFTSSLGVYVLTSFVLISESVSWCLRFRGRNLQSVAHEALRRGMIVDALGTSPAPLDLADLRQRLGTEVEKVAGTFQGAGYYESLEPVGAKRLKDHLQESAFFSKWLFKTASKLALLAAVGLAVLLLLAVLIFLPFLDGSSGLIVANILVLVLFFTVSVDILGYAIEWYGASEMAGHVVHRLEHLDVNNLGEILAVFSDYAIGISSAPPIPTRIYTNQRDRLNEMWNQSRLRRSAS